RLCSMYTGPVSLNVPESLSLLVTALRHTGGTLAENQDHLAHKSGGVPMFNKVLVANRGEIAVRAFRACHELNAKTVVVFPYEDRNSIHRQKADEAYQIGEEGHPVRAYLDVDSIIKVALESGADAIYPGYGFLAENAELARKAKENDLTFVGPPAEVLEQTGNKVASLRAAERAGV